jgi:uncharacterized protein
MIADSDFLAKVKTNQKQDVQQAVRERPELANARDANGVTAVLLAIYCGHRELAEWLAENGANLNFFEACALGRQALVKQMLTGNRALISEYSADGFKGLGLACFFGNADVVRELLDGGANVNVAARNQMRVAPIHSAGANRDPAIALAISKMLVDGGADVNVAQEGGWTPLHGAAAHGNLDLVRFLLDHGADRNAVGKNGKTAFQLAVEANHSETAALLQSVSTH